MRSLIGADFLQSARPTTATTFGFRPQGDLKGTVDTLGNEVSPSEAERARESSQVRSIPNLSLEKTLIPD